MVKGTRIKQKKNSKKQQQWSEEQVTEKAYYSQGRIYKTFLLQLHLQSKRTMKLQRKY